MSENGNNNEIKNLVMTRLETLPSDAVVSLGSSGEFTKDQIIESVRRGDENGKKMIEIEMTFLQGLKDGILYGATSFSN
ncbi:hypothetical protein A3H53_04675 [Candidatus Nomurabacteria bacterium RIFCSPLOWO2_02_FULL_40_10]|uniref:Uncharacterized protein n=2 Tax=Candidatus Nomuraibacteriota TaxID=1752729 RepID=A0A1F6XY55_9BACT|nr:MAG: hypothetical protein A2642_00650 [Candidatus Nomurabacteria bacterium RIFCSPHIGHO2_01_FULL_39_10]OGI99023.1 MAG: hypothetical protein A3H53_04675 [Candidatus Nomurabacteria bacterium RIFCSPLOWO2_02_FULL_40_10]